MPPLPSTHALFVIALTGVTLYLFSRDRIPLQTTGLGVILILILSFELFPYGDIRPAHFLANFGNEALITVCALMIAGRGLETTGALQPLATVMASRWKSNPQSALFLTLVVGAVASAFLNNTPIVVMSLPVLVASAMRARRSPSGILLPMGLATLIGGMATTIGTSTNLLVVGIAEEMGAGHLGMFDFSLPVIIAGSAGLLFLWLLAPRLLPERKPAMSDTSPRLFYTILHVNEDSFANGKTLSEVLERTDNRMKVERIQRSESLTVVRLPSVTLQAGDRLYVRDSPERLKEYEKALGATLYNTGDESNPISEATPLDGGGQQLAEVVVSRGSPLTHRTLDAVHFASRFHLWPLALHRPRSSQELSGDLGTVRMRVGDVILVQGSQEAIQELRTSGSMLVLDATLDLPYTQRAPLALGIMITVVALAATGLLPISVAALLGVAAMVLSGCMQWRDVADALNLPLIMIIVASLCLGLAMLDTGGAQYIAQLFVAATHTLPTAMILSGLILLITLLTNLVSNNAAAAIGTPVAVSIANQLGAPMEPFVLAVIFGANMSFATPIGYQTNLLIMSAGGYRFSDFLRVGLPLTLIMWLAFSALLPLLYELG